MDAWLTDLRKAKELAKIFTIYNITWFGAQYFDHTQFSTKEPIENCHDFFAGSFIKLSSNSLKIKRHKTGG